MRAGKSKVHEEWALLLRLIVAMSLPTRLVKSLSHQVVIDSPRLDYAHDVICPTAVTELARVIATVSWFVIGLKIRNLFRFVAYV